MSLLPKFTPTTKQARAAYVVHTSSNPEDLSRRAEAFDRWLAEHDRQVAERAWNEGADAIWYGAPTERSSVVNPYKAGGDTDGR